MKQDNKSVLETEAVTRRTFLKRAGAAGIAAGTVLSGVDKIKALAASDENKQMGSLIDLTKCDGCPGEEIPLCVLACREKNAMHYPQPEYPLKNYWPQKRYEDWSDNPERIDRLTPYNWTYVEHVEVEHNGVNKQVSIPRRCMHCFDPPCQKLCPFGTIYKSEQGAVYIDREFCMGGSKCREVCPWEIPQRQAGVGLYLKLVPELAGGGVMYKCDMCVDLLQEGKEPVCSTSCPRGAITFGPMEEIRRLAHQRKEEINGYIYGEKENGGTATLYVSEVPFEKIDQAIAKSKQADPEKRGRPHMKPEVENMLDTAKGWMMATAIAPVAGAAAAGIAAYKSLKGKQDTSSKEEVGKDG